jgi:hypothetical protein
VVPVARDFGGIGSARGGTSCLRLQRQHFGVRSVMTQHIIARLKEWLEVAEPLKQDWYDRSEVRRAGILCAISEERDRRLAQLLKPPPEMLADSALHSSLMEVSAYMRRCDWNLFDPVALMAAGSTTPSEAAAEVVPRMFVYHAFRMIDDVIDDHTQYKGSYPTSLGELRRV